MPKQIMAKLNIGKGGFKRNFLLMFSSKAYAIVLTVFTTPIISRLFTPFEYGSFTIYNTIIQNFMMLSTLGYGETLLIINNKHEIG